MLPTHHYKGYGAIANLASLSVKPETRRFDEEVQLLAVSGFYVLLLDAANGLWVTDVDAWERNSQEID